MPLDRAQASKVRIAYSTTWQFWNVLRSCAVDLALLLTAAGLLRVAPPRRDSVKA
ncbi:MAG: hypothetical protein ACKVLN_06225 [Rhodobacterales bacterium]